MNPAGALFSNSKEFQEVSEDKTLTSLNDN
jgi:hypothetical protein